MEGRALPLIMSETVYAAGNFGIFHEGSDQLLPLSLLAVYTRTWPDVKVQKLIQTLLENTIVYRETNYPRLNNCECLFLKN